MKTIQDMRAKMAARRQKLDASPPVVIISTPRNNTTRALRPVTTEAAAPQEVDSIPEAIAAQITDEATAEDTANVPSGTDCLSSPAVEFVPAERSVGSRPNKHSGISPSDSGRESPELLEVVKEEQVASQAVAIVDQQPPQVIASEKVPDASSATNEKLTADSQELPEANKDADTLKEKKSALDTWLDGALSRFLNPDSRPARDDSVSTRATVSTMPEVDGKIASDDDIDSSFDTEAVGSDDEGETADASDDKPGQWLKEKPDPNIVPDPSLVDLIDFKECDKKLPLAALNRGQDEQANLLSENHHLRILIADKDEELRIQKELSHEKLLEKQRVIDEKQLIIDDLAQRLAEMEAALARVSTGSPTQA